MQLEQVVKSLQLLETQLLLMLLLLHPFNGLFSRTTWVSQHQKGKTSMDFNKARDDGVLGWQWHQLNNMQTICIAPDGAIQSARSRETTTPTPHHPIFTGQMLFLMPNQQRQSTERHYWRHNSWHRVYSMPSWLFPDSSTQQLHYYGPQIWGDSLLLTDYNCLIWQAKTTKLHNMQAYNLSEL